MGSSPLSGYSKSVGSVDECVFVVEVACMIGILLVAMTATGRDRGPILDSGCRDGRLRYACR
jgi:hypothetical protein